MMYVYKTRCMNSQLIKTEIFNRAMAVNIHYVHVKSKDIKDYCLVKMSEKEKFILLVSHQNNCGVWLCLGRSM